MIDLSYEKVNQIGVLTINRPARGNALTHATFYEMENFIKGLYDDRDIRVLIITGAGSKFFCAGLDLGDLEDSTEGDNLWQFDRLQAIFTDLEELHIPVIAAINGYCIGGGVELIAACDIRLCSENAKFSLPEVRYGFPPDLGGNHRIPRIVGLGQAKRLILGGMTIDAEEALRIRLVEQMVPADKLMEEAMTLAEQMAKNAPIALRFAKRAINLSADLSVRQGLMHDQAAVLYCLSTEDQPEAVKAFLEKRKPEFKGK